MSRFKRRISFLISAVVSFFLFITTLDYFKITYTLNKASSLYEFSILQSNENDSPFILAKRHKFNYKDNLSKAEKSVWRSDRKKYFSKAEKEIQNYLVYYPTDSRAWLNLLSIQYTLYGIDEELNWSIAQNLKWNSWNEKYMSVIAFYCVQNWQVLPQKLQDECVADIDTLIDNEYYKKQLGHEIGNLSSWNDVYIRLKN